MSCGLVKKLEIKYSLQKIIAFFQPATRNPQPVELAIRN